MKKTYRGKTIIRKEQIKEMKGGGGGEGRKREGREREGRGGRSYFRTVAEVTVFLTTEKSMVSSARNLT